MTDVFEYGLLEDLEKRDLCRALLGEFGVTRVQETTKGELIHSCCIPHTRHKNGDKNASASLNYKKLTYNCFGCGSSGGILWLIAICRGVEGDAAREWLSSQTGLGQSAMDPDRLQELITAIFHQKPEERVVPRYDPLVLEPWRDWARFHPYLTDSGPIPGYGMNGREIPPETCEHFQLGYADQYYTDGGERIIIPLFWQGHLVGWQARALEKGVKDKYRNSPDFPRELALYNHEKRPGIVLVESPMSVLRHFHHVPELQSSFGSKVTDEQLRLIQRYRRVVLWFDNDDAGWKGTRHVAESLSRYVQVWVVESHYDADPADLDDSTVEELLSSVVPYSIWEQPTPESLKKWVAA